jgi:hypothetical protein
MYESNKQFWKDNQGKVYNSQTQQYSYDVYYHNRGPIVIIYIIWILLCLTVIYLSLIIFLTVWDGKHQILERIGNNMLKWYGHVVRMEGNRWPKRTITWSPRGRRLRVRPETKWRKELESLMK